MRKQVVSIHKTIDKTMETVCSVMLMTPVKLLAFCCIFYVNQPISFIPDDSNFHYVLYDINDMNIIVKESFLSCILNTHNQRKNVFTTMLSRFSYLLILLLLGGDSEICLGARTRCQTFATAEDLKLSIKM